MVKIVEFTDSGQRKGIVEVEKVHKTDAEWKKQLDARGVSRHEEEGTERAFTGKYLE